MKENGESDKCRQCIGRNSQTVIRRDRGRNQEGKGGGEKRGSAVLAQ